MSCVKAASMSPGQAAVPSSAACSTASAELGVTDTAGRAPTGDPPPTAGAPAGPTTGPPDALHAAPDHASPGSGGSCSSGNSVSSVQSVESFNVSLNMKICLAAAGAARALHAQQLRHVGPLHAQPRHRARRARVQRRQQRAAKHCGAATYRAAGRAGAAAARRRRPGRRGRRARAARAAAASCRAAPRTAAPPRPPGTRPAPSAARCQALRGGYVPGGRSGGCSCSAAAKAWPPRAPRARCTRSSCVM
ncbi:hypothetical protein ACJJTC_011649 [Scirpophaga incertulas]